MADIQTRHEITSTDFSSGNILDLHKSNLPAIEMARREALAIAALADEQRGVVGEGHDASCGSQKTQQSLGVASTFELPRGPEDPAALSLELASVYILNISDSITQLRTQAIEDSKHAA